MSQTTDNRGRKMENNNILAILIRRLSSVVRPPNCMHAEQAVAPDAHRRPASGQRQRLETFDRVFVAVFGVNRFAEPKIKGLAVDTHLLPLEARKVHLDPALLAVIASVMLERGEVEIGVKLAIDPRQQVQVEFGGDAFRIVVGGTQHLDALNEIVADNENSSVAKGRAGMIQEFYRLVMLEIADSRSRKKTDTRQIGDRRRHVKRQRKVGDHRMNRQPREIAT